MKRDPGNTLKKAQKINVSEDPFSIKNKINAQDRNDIFRFRIRSKYELDLTLSGLQGNADLELYTFKKKRGKVLKNIGKIEFSDLKKKDIRRNLQRIARSKKAGKNDEQIDKILDPGWYYIRVFSKKSIKTKYKLQLDLSKVTTTPNPPVLPPPEKKFQRRWIQQFGTAQDDQGLAIALERNGQNVYVAGSTGGSLLDASATNTDAFIRKYSKDGAEQWQRTFGSTDGDAIDTIAVDTANNIYGVGITDFVPPSGFNLGEVNASFFKYDANGTQIFNRKIDQGDLETGAGISLDSNNNFYTVGRNFTLDLFSAQIDVSPFINQYTSDGKFQREIDINLNSQGYASRVLIDDANNLYVTGITNATLSLTDPDNPLIGDIFVAKYDNNGQQLWLQTLGSSEADFVNGIALDASENIYITGDTQGSLPDNSNQGETDAYLAKFNGNGDRLWVKQYGTTGTDQSVGVAIDSNGMIYLAGETDGTLFGNTSIGQSDGWLAQFDTNGTAIKSTFIGTAENDRVNRISVDAAGTIYLTGETAGNLGGTNQGGLDAWIAAYSLS